MRLEIVRLEIVDPEAKADVGPEPTENAVTHPGPAEPAQPGASGAPEQVVDRVGPVATDRVVTEGAGTAPDALPPPPSTGTPPSPSWHPSSCRWPSS